MKVVIKKIMSCWVYLFNFKNYKTSEIVQKSLLIIIVLPFFALIFTIAMILFLIERILAPFFKLFILLHITIIQKRFESSLAIKRLYGLSSIIITLILLPFVMGYYLAMLLKVLMKLWLKKLVLILDFQKQLTPEDIRILDDSETLPTSNVDFFFKDVKHSSALGKMLASYFNQNNDDIASLIENMSDEDPNDNPPSNL